jgi:uncharacterized protein (AIM24 family)
MQPKILAATRSQVECELHEHHPLRLVAAEGRRIQCVSGVVWITAYNQPVDVFLRPGQVFTVPNGGLVLAEAVGECRIRVDLPRSFDYSHYRSRVPEVFVRLLRGLQFKPKPSA